MQKGDLSISQSPAGCWLNQLQGTGLQLSELLLNILDPEAEMVNPFATPIQELLDRRIWSSWLQQFNPAFATG
jgi:hypothetical protein